MIALLTPSPRDPWPARLLITFLIAAAIAWIGLAHKLGAFA